MVRGDRWERSSGGDDPRQRSRGIVTRQGDGDAERRRGGSTDDDSDGNRNPRGSVAAEDAARHLGVPDVARRRVGPADHRLPGWWDEAPLRRPCDRRPPRDAEGPWRLAATRWRRRAEARA